MHANDIIYSYKPLREQYQAILGKLETLNNGGYFVNFQSAPIGSACQLQVLDQPYQMRFTPAVNEITSWHPFLGKLIFEKVLPNNEAESLLTVYFDRFANADTNANAKTVAWNLLHENDIHRLGHLLLTTVIEQFTENASS